jgi:hypothetical protein
MRNLVKLFVSALFLGIAMFSISAYASSSSGADAFGESAASVGGWTISNLEYQFSNDPSMVSDVTFDLDGPADQVSVKLISQAQDFAECSNVGGFHWQCAFPGGIRLASMDEFRVIAVGY